MSLVENLVSQLSASALGGITKPQGFDLNDDTFAKLLQSASQNLEKTQPNLFGTQFGAPAGFEIQPFDAPEPSEVKELTPVQEIEIKDLNVGNNYFSSLMNDNSNVMNLALKQATNTYNNLGRGFVENLNEFINSSTK